jgi:hypothetical protein
MRHRHASLLVICLVLLALAGQAPSAATSGQSFLYVTTPPYPCTNDSGDPCPPSELLVYDARTLGLVTRIALPANSGDHTLVFAPDGRKLYAVGSGDITVVDTATHASSLLDVTGGFGGTRRGIGVIRADGARIYIRVFNMFEGLRMVDLTTGVFSSFPTGGTNFVNGLATNPVTSRLYINANPFTGSAGLIEYDATTEQEIRRLTTVDGPLAVSPDGTRIYTDTNANVPNRIVALDATTLNQVASFNGASSFLRSSATRLYSYGFTLRVFDTQSSNPAPLVDAGFFEGFRNFVVSEDDTRIFVGTTNQTSQRFDGVNHFTYRNAVVVVDAQTGQTIRELSLPDSSHRVLGGHPVPQPDFVTGLATTPPGMPRCSYRVGTTQNAWTTAGGSTTITLTTPCSWVASSDASWVRLSQASGTSTTTLTITVDPAANSAARSATLTIGGQLVTISQAGFGSTAPFGSFDTPQEGASGISGSLAVTGWALDDAGITGVRIFRDPVASEAQGAPIFLGNATIVEGARPDVAAAFPAFPFNTRAGWGLNVLTNMLPNQGNGTFRVYAFIDDIDGRTTVLGPRTFTSSNMNATAPFGAIDTPGQGEVVSGTIVCFGWALAPQPNMIPTDGSTIDVLIDGVVVGRPSYNHFRGDIAALFPGLQNSNGAVGHFTIDTRQYANGVHTLAWVVRDLAGNAAGIGSRYFTIQN